MSDVAPDVVTAEDIRTTNDELIVRYARRGQVLGGILLGVAAVIAVLWLWITVRSQMEEGPFGYAFAEDGETDLSERIDRVATSIYLLVEAVVAAGVGAVLVLLCARLRHQHGDSLLALEPGMRLDDGDQAAAGTVDAP